MITRHPGPKPSLRGLTISSCRAAQAWHAIVNLEPETAALVVKRDGAQRERNPHARPPSTTLASMAYEPPDASRAGLSVVPGDQRVMSMVRKDAAIIA